MHEERGFERCVEQFRPSFIHAGDFYLYIFQSSEHFVLNIFTIQWDATSNNESTSITNSSILSTSLDAENYTGEDQYAKLSKEFEEYVTSKDS